MPKNRAHKKAVREYKATTGQPYTLAARNLRQAESTKVGLAAGTTSSPDQEGHCKEPAGLSSKVNCKDPNVPNYPTCDANRSLPADVLAALKEHLPSLGESTDVARIAVELLMMTGRHPREIITLQLDCLTCDRDGHPVMKICAKRPNRRNTLPIPRSAVRIIVDQQDRVRERFPDTPEDELVLLPAPGRNGSGRRHIGLQWLARKHRNWVDGLPELNTPATCLEEGQPVVRHIPFPKNHIQLSCWQLAFAQKIIDAGAPTGVLHYLLSHGRMITHDRTFQGNRRQKLAEMYAGMLSTETT